MNQLLPFKQLFLREACDLFSTKCFTLVESSFLWAGSRLVQQRLAKSKESHWRVTSACCRLVARWLAWQLCLARDCQDAGEDLSENTGAGGCLWRGWRQVGEVSYPSRSWDRHQGLAVGANILSVNFWFKPHFQLRMVVVWSVLITLANSS